MPSASSSSSTAPAAAQPMGFGQLPDGLARPQVRLDQEPALVHRRSPSSTCLLCLDTPPITDVSDVLKSDTAFPTTKSLLKWGARLGAGSPEANHPAFCPRAKLS